MSKIIPQHLGIIMDGNRRWAKEKGLPAFKGHEKGLEVAKNIIRRSKDRGIKILTLYTFSTENWQRPKKEVAFLMNLLRRAVTEDFKKYSQEGIKFKAIGQRSRLPKVLQFSLKQLENMTKNNKAMLLNIALSYGGRAEIAEAIKNIIKKGFKPEQITEEVISQNLWASDVDLLIRTGKEQRLSNFLIWQSAYAEFYFSEKYWPDFSEEDLDAALEDFTKRQRRHGK